MQTENIKVSKLKLNPNNPRVIKDDKYKKLLKSIKDFPKMLELRPIVVNDDMIVLGGNQRLKACKEAGYKEVPTIKASELTADEQREFIIKDNIGFGENDWNMLANEWDKDELEEWGLEVYYPPVDVDYSLLDDEDVDDDLQDMADGVKKAIQIEFEPDHYQEAYELVKYWRDQDAYVGKMILDFLKAEKEKL